MCVRVCVQHTRVKLLPSLLPPPKTATMFPFTASHHELEVEAAGREAARIEARRARDAARLGRLVDARSRTAGRDAAGLEAQIQEKSERDAAARAEAAREGKLLLLSHSLSLCCSAAMCGGNGGEGGLLCGERGGVLAREGGVA